AQLLQVLDGRRTVGGVVPGVDAVALPREVPGLAAVQPQELGGSPADDEDDRPWRHGGPGHFANARLGLLVGGVPAPGQGFFVARAAGTAGAAWTVRAPGAAGAGETAGAARATGPDLAASNRFRWEEISRRNSSSVWSRWSR